jgi:deoxyribodipyrimidine photo-lyase
MMPSLSVFWFRRDLRLNDNAGLYRALKAGVPILPIFIFDTDILDKLDNKADKRVTYIHNAIQQLQQQLTGMGSSLHVWHGRPADVFDRLLAEYKVTTVYTNHDYEPYAIARDKKIADMLAQHGIQLHTYKDQVIFERSEVVKDNGEPYTVFTPYSRKWKQKLNEFFLKPYPTEKYFGNFYKCPPQPLPTLTDIGFTYADPHTGAAILNEAVAATYDKTRDRPAIAGTTRLSLHLRFGTISIRQLATQVKALNETLLNELIWREFYMAILWYFPHVVGGSFKREYDKIPWRNNEQEFERWKQGQTGYPIVDAGMRELNTTGFMHNRVRMITASFLTKHLLIDWRWGEAYFAEKLLDYDLSANNGGWQWAAGSGCDAAPYFRIFNPYLQTQKFDPDLKYIRKWTPEYEQLTYVPPIVDHAVARERCLAVYKKGLGKAV